MPAILFSRETDLIIGVDPSVSDLDALTPEIEDAVMALDVHGDLVHIALIAPDETEFDATCEGGCTTCNRAPPLSSVQTVPPGALMHPLGVFTPPTEYACVLRPGDRNGPGALRAYVSVTWDSNPSNAIPNSAIVALDRPDTFYHVACPGCGGENPDSVLEDLAAEYSGLASDLDQPGALADLLIYAGTPRVGCAWLPQQPADVDNLSLSFSSGRVGADVALEFVPDIDACDPETDELPLQWTTATVQRDVIVALCPALCAEAQLEPAMSGVAGFPGITIVEEYCQDVDG
ncbi:MAG: hypothetical protein JKY37_11995 [Nannocystaceae bacterium]|nr:hypothetical protein [Nannocystaceae bacterium]